MRFQLVSSRFMSPPSAPCILLERTEWDDHKYKTMFRAFYADGTAPVRPLGRVKILKAGKLEPFPESVTSTLEPFAQLDESFCSLGQEPDYYDNIVAQFGDSARDIFVALRDLAVTPSIEESFAREDGLRKSLLRFPNAELARARGRQIFVGFQVPSAETLAFTFTCHLRGFEDSHQIEFSFPSNKKDKLGRIVAIAGRNGTGKTQLVARLAQVLSGLEANKPELQRIDPEQRLRVVIVSFNAFDQFTTPRRNVPGGDYSYYGLRSRITRTTEARLDGGPDAAVDMERALDRLKDSVEQIWKMGRASQEAWGDLLERLHVFVGEQGLVNPFQPLTGASPEEHLQERLGGFIKRLRDASAGHQLLVFIVTALVESVREKSVLLLDEPETHLHPRLLSTLVRELYDMLIERNAYAVIATHSPIVLQEIPGSSIRLLRVCEGRLPLVKPYPGESFGESLDEIIKEAFGVDEDDRSYATILRELVKQGMGRADIERRFDGLGYGARLLLRELLETKGGR